MTASTKVLGGLLIVALIVIGVQNLPKKKKVKPTGTPSPVRVMGGSMTFRSQNRWTPNGCRGCWSTTLNNPITGVELDGVEGNPSPINLSNSWTVYIWARDANGDSPRGDGIRISGTAAQVGLAPIGSGGFYPFRNGKGAPEDSGRHGIRYRDASCDLNSGALCDHIGLVTVNGTDYLCTDGECRIRFRTP